jgi:signal transduction histidine kinase
MVVLAFVVPLGAVVNGLADSRVRDSAERNAQSLANVLGVILASGQPLGTLEDVIASLTFDPGEEASVFLPDGTVLGAPGQIDQNVVVARRGQAFTTRTARGVEAFVPVLGSGATPPVVRVTVSSDQLTRTVQGTWLVLGLLALALVGAAVLVADRLGRSMVRPVERLAAAAHRLGSGQLDARVSPEGPGELVEVGRAFNRLADRIRELLAAERELVADLSHRLRTPLTALRLDAESVHDEQLGKQLADDVAALERAVDGIIDQARRPVGETIRASADLGRIVADRAAFWSVLAEEQGRPWSVEIADGAHQVGISTHDLEAVVDALLGNVFAHTPEKAGCRTSVVADVGGGSRLVIEDDGPGFAGSAAVARGASGTGSTGLGLDIARRTAERAGGGLSVSRGARGGARVEVWFGPGNE